MRQCFRPNLLAAIGERFSPLHGLNKSASEKSAKNLNKKRFAFFRPTARNF